MTADHEVTPVLEALRARLEASRAGLLAALEGVTERDFTAEIGPGTTLITALAALAPAERASVRDARAAVGAPERPLPGGGAAAGRATPPQVVHDLAGARYETLLFLDYLEARPGVAEPAVTSDLEAIAANEAAVAAQISARGEMAHPA